MSVREHRLCDYPECNLPAAGACDLCKRDACKAHLGAHYITVAALEGNFDNQQTPECFGRCDGVRICSGCHELLYPATKSLMLSEGAGVTPLSPLLQPLRDKLIEATAAFLAERRLAKQVAGAKKT